MENHKSLKTSPLRELFSWHEDCSEKERVERQMADDSQETASSPEERVDE